MEAGQQLINYYILRTKRPACKGRRFWWLYKLDKTIAKKTQNGGGMYIKKAKATNAHARKQQAIQP